MKKIFGFIALLCAVIGFTSCNPKNKKNDCVIDENKKEVANLVPENLISMDRQDMFMNHSNDYRWFETCMKLENFLDEENDGKLAEVVNVFQAIEQRSETSFDTKVFKYQHFSDGVNVCDSVIGFWIEDYPLEEETIKISYKEAYDKLMATNMPKPHSRYVTLRKQVGPKDANPQYIFGNLRECIFVDAITGEVRDYNPAFEDGNGGGFKMPLGEWP